MRPTDLPFAKDNHSEDVIYLYAINEDARKGATDGYKSCGAMVVNHSFNESYRDFDWPTKAEDDEITVIHALGVHPKYMGKGIAKRMVRFVINKANEEGQKAIRLDVLKGNLPAEKLYSGLGFKYLNTLVCPALSVL